MPDKIAFLFPGQGSQYIGMGKEFYDSSSEAKEIFEQLDDICGKSISKLCFGGPMDELTLTENVQPAITAVSLVCLGAMEKSGVRADISAGHSLGEFGALTSAGVLDPIDALRIVQKRGELMHREAIANPGVMAAILGMEIDTVSEIVDRAGEKGIVVIANHNSAQQIVITGEKEAVEHAMELVKNQGGKAISLAVSGAWHCSLMKNAVDEFRTFMDTISFSDPESIVLFNSTAEAETDPEKIKDIMARQLVSPVKWYDLILKMLDLGVDTFVEVGPKKVLTGLIKKIVPSDSDIKSFSVDDPKSLDVFIEASQS